MTNESRSEVERTIGRAMLDKDFFQNIYLGFDKWESEHLQIPDDDITRIHESVEKIKKINSSVLTENEKNEDYNTKFIKQVEHISENVTKYSIDVLKMSIGSSKKAFDRISLMFYIIFAVGITLFILSAISGLLGDRSYESAIFGTLGLINFVVFFIFGPSSNVQRALSNLLQAEIIFINFWDQLHFWVPYGLSKDKHEKEMGSAKLQELTEKILKMLESYLEKGGSQGMFNWQSLLQRSKPS
jgi:hypothetical protein